MHYATFTTRKNAERACDKSVKCSGVYDAQCDGKGPWYTCRVGIDYETASKHTKHCVYTKEKTVTITAATGGVPLHVVII